MTTLRTPDRTAPGPAAPGAAPRAALLAASLRLDRALLGCRQLPRPLRRRVLTGKYAALGRLLRGRPARLCLPGLRFGLSTVSDLGTLQSALVDVHDMLLANRMLDRQAPTVVDVGANVGQFTAALLLTCAAPRIVCVEPDPAVHERLLHNVGGRAGVTTHQCAAGPAPGTARLHRHELSVMSSLRPVGPGYRGDQVDVPVRTVDDIAADLPAIDLLKIDVEGFELDVVRGATETLRRSRLLLLEVGLSRDLRGESLEVLGLVKRVRPAARLLRTGRPLGPATAPIGQDLLIALHD